MDVDESIHGWIAIQQYMCDWEKILENQNNNIIKITDKTYPIIFMGL